MPEDVKKFLKNTEHKTGAHMFIMAAYEKQDGTVAVTK